MAEIDDKLAWVSKNIYKTQDYISQASLKDKVTRQTVARSIGKAIENLNRNLNVLPNSLKYQNQDLVAGLRKIATSSNSIVQALNDKVCKADTAKKLIKPINADLRKLNRLIRSSLAERITLARSREGGVPENIMLQVEKSIIASDKPKVTLNSLADLDKYTSFIDDMKKQLNQIDAGIDNDAGVADIDPEKAAEYSKSLERPVENLHFRENVYDQRVNENALSTQRALHDVFGQMPKQVKLDKTGFTIIRAPILAITQYYIADTVLRKSGLKFLRMPGSFSAGYTPGLSVKSAGGDSSYIIFQNQLLLALPAGLLKEPEKLRELRRDAMRSLENRLGKLSMVRFGSNISKLLDKELIDDTGKKDKASFDQALDKREYFSNKGYPGIIFMWMLPTERFSSLGNIRFLNINLATAPGLKNTIDPANYAKPDKGQETETEKRLREDQTGHEDRLKALQIAKAEKDKVTAPLRLQSEQLEAKIKAVRRDAKEATDQLAMAKATLQQNTNQLANLVPGSASHKAQLAARAAASNAAAHFQGELDAIVKDQLPILYKQRIALKAKIDLAVAEFIAKRRKKKHG